ncbi:alpha-glucuronidase [Levilactobacillus enshiensis]|uniref:alpha-glucuronidase n=1 Tax=Levilactobacillus enshiensis TaxID=2590213 RepID=UPI001CDD4883|nr:alpha-glucuronidase [Levilactobacillus enshiensis]
MDVTWVDKNNVLLFMGNDVFYFDQAEIEGHDVVGLRLRTEVNDWLGCKITDDRQQATIIFDYCQSKFENNDTYHIYQEGTRTIIEGNQSKSLLYGFYALIRLRMNHQSEADYTSTPDQSIRMVDHWDQIDGSVERGYAGASIFFGALDKLDNPDRGDFGVEKVDGDPFRRNPEKIVTYARLLSSAGINAISLNNVNVRGQGTNLIVEPYLTGVAELATTFREFGIKLFLAINWESPKHLGNLTTSDPLDAGVISFWKDICRNIYQKIPDFGGFLVKADSEGEPGPYQYGRTHAEGANMLAQAVAPYQGIIIWRTFVYNSKQDWRDRHTDRAKAAFDNFKPLDGQFADNVVLQIKFGPIDFQTAEPLSPLFGALKKTNQIMEFEISAEYLGHQIDVNYAVPQWRQMMNAATGQTQFKDERAGQVIRETSLNSKNTGFAAVGNVGMSPYWTGNPLALANLYGFGRLCWDNQAAADDILNEWLSQTFAEVQPATRKTIFEIMSSSNETYRMYNAPLGVGFMVVPHFHYGVSVNGYEYDRWGTYHFADRNGVGVDRTQATGSGFTELYAPKIAAQYENVKTTPDELVLFFHHLSYQQVLQNGQTLIQTIYNQHFEGYERVENYLKQWQTLSTDLNKPVYEKVLQCLKLQLQNALEWRDQVNTYFYRMSGVKDDQGRKIYR